MDSSLLWARGQVEDTLNLLGHAVHRVTGGLAVLAQQEVAHAIDLCERVAIKHGLAQVSRAKGIRRGMAVPATIPIA